MDKVIVFRDCELFSENNLGVEDPRIGGEMSQKSLSEKQRKERITNRLEKALRPHKFNV